MTRPKTLLLAIALAAMSLTALTAPAGASAAAAAPETPASQPPSGPSLSKASLKDGVLKLTARCDGKATATVRTGRRRLGSLAMSCARGAAVRLRLPRAVAARANRAGGLALEVHLRDRKGSATIPVSFVRPEARGSSGPAARSALAPYWDSSAMNWCYWFPSMPTMHIDIHAGRGSYGYPLGRQLLLGATIQLWSSALGWQTYWLGWKNYNSESFATSWGWQAQQGYRGVYARTYITVYQSGVSKWVRVDKTPYEGGIYYGTDGTQWCHFA